MDERSGSERKAYFANSMDGSQKIKQTLTIRIEELLVSRAVSSSSRHVPSCKYMTRMNRHAQAVLVMNAHIPLCALSNLLFEMWRDPWSRHDTRLGTLVGEFWPI
jgi:hypothetical protein